MSRIQKRATRNKVNIIQQVADEASTRGMTELKTKSAMEWVKNFIAKNVYKVKVFENLEQKYKKTRPTIGKMYMYGYDAKGKDDLPFWDAFPCTIFFSEGPDTVTGYNLHYVPVAMRLIVLGKLYEILNDDVITEKTRLTKSYQFLKGLSTHKMMAPMIHSYLKTNFTTPLVEVPATQWPIAAFLPVAQWQKASFNTVYADSKKKMR